MKAVVIFWSMTGNTKMMAEAIAKGAKADLFNVSEIAPAKVENYDLVILGCPAMGADELDDTEFLLFYEEIAPLLIDKKVALFGSYEWNDGGPWMDNWLADASAKGITVSDSLRVYSTPSETDLAKCEEFGKNLIE